MTKEWQFNNLSNVNLSIFASKAGGRQDAEIIEFSFLKADNFVKKVR